MTWKSELRTMPVADQHRVMLAITTLDVAEQIILERLYELNRILNGVPVPRQRIELKVVR